jgi:hypothetical protein
MVAQQTILARIAAHGFEPILSTDPDAPTCDPCYFRCPTRKCAYTGPEFKALIAAAGTGVLCSSSRSHFQDLGGPRFLGWRRETFAYPED